MVAKPAVLLVLFCVLILPGRLMAACSPYVGKVAINEVLTTQADRVTPFVELFVAEALEIKSGWRLIVQGNTSRPGNSGGAAVVKEVPAATYPAGSYILLDFSGGELKTPGNDLLLSDDEGRDVDFLRFGGDESPLTPSCDHLDSSRVPYQPGDRQVCSLPDGHPELVDDWEAASCVPSPGGSNQPVGAGCELAGFELMPDVTALACPDTRAAVGIRALCDDGSTKTDYQGRIFLASSENGTRFFAEASGGDAIAEYAFVPEDAGLATLYFYHDDEALVSVSVEDPDAGVLSWSEGTDFRAFGLRAEALPSLASCEASPSLALVAYGRLDQASGCGVLEGFEGGKELKIWSEYVLPATNPSESRVTINGAATLPAVESSRYRLDFVNGRALFNLSYPDAGRIRVRFKHDDSPYAGDPYAAMEADTGPIDVVPAGFGIVASNAAGSLHGEGPRAGTMQPAGLPFTLQIQAQCGDGTRTPNYQPVSAELRVTQDQPRPGQLAFAGETLVADGRVQSITALFKEGAVSDANTRYSEVGSLTLSVEDSGFPGGPVGPAGAAVGRFHPHYFELEVAEAGVLESPCDSFVYSGQLGAESKGALGYPTTPPLLRIVPRSAEGELTVNYQGEYATLTVDGVVVAPPLVDGAALGADGASALAITASMAQGSLTPAEVDGEAGYLDYRLNPADGFYYVRDANSRVAPFVSQLAFSVQEVRDFNGDGVNGNDVLAQGPLPTLAPAGVEVRFGRLRLANAFGPETEALSVPLTAEYFDGSGFALNRLDGCTVYRAGQAELDHAPYGDDNLTPGDTEMLAPQAETTLQGGVSAVGGALQVAAPGEGREGQVDLILDVGAWLEFDWDGSGQRDPKAQLTFGRYRGHDRVILWQERLGQ
ncbi:DUF6701 domain-containing protein [Motiliproteus sp. SC1-56]|uniref:DUF6701 domain-containing protein n=1 Tax=Motiliproteus sp. SC1-56 TaxID=2799565 RepID=UPI001A8FA93B|nr:DUF6701 domain-containing protein [Motiliproteus sp. SC1-56]